MARELVALIKVRGFEDPLTAHVTLDGSEDPLTAIKKLSAFEEPLFMEVQIKGMPGALDVTTEPGK